MVMMVSRMRMRAVMMVMVMRCIRDQIRMRERVRWKADRIERTRPIINCFMVMMMVMRMDVMVMVVRVVGLRPFGSVLHIWCLSPVAVNLLIVISDSSTILLAISRPILGGALCILFDLGYSCVHQIPSFDMSSWTQARRCSCAIHRPPSIRRGSPCPTAQTREHATEFHLNARIVASRSNMPRLRALHSLRQR